MRYSKPLVAATHHGLCGPQASQIKSQAVASLQVQESVEVCKFCAVLEICAMPNTVANVVSQGSFASTYEHTHVTYTTCTSCQVEMLSQPLRFASANFVSTHLRIAVGAVGFAQVAVSILISQVCMALNSTWCTALPCSYDRTD